jgi:hypothetical protein
VTPHPTGAATGLAVAGGLAAASWLVVVAGVAAATRPHRPRPAPAPVPAGPEPPAVAALLAGGCRLRPEAWAGTLLDLAARGRYRIVARPGGELRCLAAGPAAGPGALAAYELAALAHVRARLAPTGEAPPSALGSGHRAGADAGWTQFRDGVIAEAAQLGLVRRRVGRPLIAVLRVAAVVPGVLVFLALHAARPGAAGVVTGLFFGYLTFGVLGFPVLGVLRGVRPTRPGRAAGARWRGLAAMLRQAPETPPVRPGDRMPAYAAALGAAPALAAAFGGLPRDAIWSSYGGRWRLVRRGSPSERMITNPVLAVLVGVWAVLFVAGIAAAAQFSRSAYGWIAVIGAAAVAGLALVLTVRALARNLRLPTEVTVDGQVVDSWLVTGDAETPDLHCLAVDDGWSEVAWSLAVPAATRARLGVGDHVRLRVDARRNRMLEITRRTPGTSLPQRAEPGPGPDPG